MAEINHRIGIAGSLDEIYAALTTNDGLSSWWWTTDTTGAGDVGSTIKFRFGGGGPDFEVTELVKNALVKWKHSGNVPEDWEGSEVSFELRKEKKEVIVLFRHFNWNEASEFMSHCSTKWAVFMLSLKDAIENGQGRPFPNDINIDHS